MAGAAELVSLRHRVRAQVLFAPVPAAPAELFVRQTFGIGRHGRHFSFSAYISNSYGVGVYAPYPYGGFPISRLTIFSYVPGPVAVPIGVPVPFPVPVAVPVAVAAAAAGPADNAADMEPPVYNPTEMDCIMPRRKAPALAKNDGEKGLLIQPRPRQDDEVPAKPALPPAPERLAAPPPARIEPPVPNPAAPDLPPDPTARQLLLGKEAFAAQQYGLAERRFFQATQTNPAEPLAHFLLAQADFALGKYQEAVEAIHAGLRLQPVWPLTPFRPAQLYQANAADFKEQLQQLEATLAAHPRDPVLLFLTGYQLWFDGRQEEARPYFERAAAGAADRTFIDRFLQARPTIPVVTK